MSKNDNDSQKSYVEYEYALVKLIKDEHPILWKGELTRQEDLTEAKVQMLIKDAWKTIGEKLKDSPYQNHKMVWKNIYSSYFILRYPQYNLPKPATERPTTSFNIFTDGTLGFLDSQFRNILTHKKLINQRSSAKKVHFVDSSIPKDIYSIVGVEVEGITIEIDDDEDEKLSSLKKRKMARKSKAKNNDTVTKKKDPNILAKTMKFKACEAKEEISGSVICVDVDTVICIDDDTPGVNKETVPGPTKKPVTKKVWNEEELLNATRLTQEMILELIRIKSRKQ